MQTLWKKIRRILMIVMCVVAILGIVLSYVYKDETFDWRYFCTFYFPLEPLLLFFCWAEDRFEEGDADDVRKNEQSGRK